MANSLPPESVLFNVSFHTKTSNTMNNIESGEGGFQKQPLTLKFLRGEYQMSQPILQLSVTSHTGILRLITKFLSPRENFVLSLRL